MKRIEKLIAEKNRILAEIQGIMEGGSASNSLKLNEEIRNLLDGVGKGFVREDYFARSRYYSEIPGVKNFRIHKRKGVLLVKVNSREGYFLPGILEIRGKIYIIEFIRSEGYGQ